MRRLLRHLLFGLALCSATTLAPRHGLAQPAQGAAAKRGQPTKEELAAARQMFTDALALEEENDWAGALANLEKVGQIKMTPQVRFHIALCHEKLGRWVDAINGFELAAQEAKQAGDKARAVMTNAPKRAEALRGKVAHLTLTLSGRRTVSKVLLDGNPVSDVLFGSDIPVDPGEHTVKVERDGEVTFEETLSFEEAQSRSLELTIDDPEVVPVPKPDPGSGGGGAGGGGDVPGEEQRIPAYVVGGLGIAALAAGGVLWGLRESALAEVAANCEDPDTFSGCDSRDDPTFVQAFNYDIASKVSFGVGGAALATGVVLFFVLAPDGAPQSSTDPDDSAAEPEPTVQLLPMLSPNYTGFSLVGTF